MIQKNLRDDSFVEAAWVDTVNSREVKNFGCSAIGQGAETETLFNCYAGEIANLLIKAGETVEQRRLS